MTEPGFKAALKGEDCGLGQTITIIANSFHFSHFTDKEPETQSGGGPVQDGVGAAAATRRSGRSPFSGVSLR